MYRRALAAFFGTMLWIAPVPVLAEEAPVTAAAPQDGTAVVAHVVAPGDTLYRLAKVYGVTIESIAKLNHLDGFTIKVGQRLLIPAKNTKLVPLPPSDLSEPGGESKPSGPADSTASGVSSVEAPAADVPNLENCVIRLSYEERELLARLVYAESRGEPFDGQVAVAAVVVNRVKHLAFPKSVTEVICEPGQFKSFENGRVDQARPDTETYRAVDAALRGEDPTGGALFFYNPVTSKALAFWSTRPITARIGNHNFAR